MTDPPLASLDDFASALSTAGYTVDLRHLGDDEVVLAETPYALVVIMQCDSWRHLRQRVSNAQAELTRLADDAPSPRKWDLYLLAHVLVPAADARDESLVEEIEADTHYVRKFVRVAVDARIPGAVDRALRPLLPIRPSPQFDLSDPLDALTQELRDLDVPDDVVSSALAAFRNGNGVRIP